MTTPNFVERASLLGQPFVATQLQLKLRLVCPVLKEVYLPTPDFDVDILILDDNPTILENLTLLFNGTYTTATFERVEEALDYLRRHKAKIIITDLRMPTMNGFMFISEAKRLHPNCQTILMSAFIDARSPADRAIFERYTRHAVSKPYTIDEMLGMVEQLIA